jgi:hypothetical protein
MMSLRWATIFVLSPLLLLIPVAGRGTGTDWPPFLGAQEQYPAAVVAAVARLWSDATFHRIVEGEPAEVPLTAYLRFVDAPDLTAAAARRLGLARYEVEPLGHGWYAADDRSGARGLYLVVLRDETRRAVVSWGTHRGLVLGAITGSALTLLEFDARGEQTAQRLHAHVLIDNRAAAGLTRTLLPLFGSVVDRKLTEGFRVTSRVAAWWRERPDEFCDWLPGALPPRRLAELLPAFDECRSLDLRRRDDLARGEARAAPPSPALAPRRLKPAPPSRSARPGA